MNTRTVGQLSDIIVNPNFQPAAVFEWGVWVCVCVVCVCVCVCVRERERERKSRKRGRYTEFVCGNICVWKYLSLLSVCMCVCDKCV
jgi:hypothetical protein